MCFELSGKSTSVVLILCGISVSETTSLKVVTSFEVALVEFVTVISVDSYVTVEAERVVAESISVFLECSVLVVVVAVWVVSARLFPAILASFEVVGKPTSIIRIPNSGSSLLKGLAPGRPAMEGVTLGSIKRGFVGTQMGQIKV